MSHSNVPNASLKCNIAETKSPNRRVPSFLIYRRIKIDNTSVFNWKPETDAWLTRRKLNCLFCSTMYYIQFPFTYQLPEEHLSVSPPSVYPSFPSCGS